MVPPLATGGAVRFRAFGSSYGITVDVERRLFFRLHGA